MCRIDLELTTTVGNGLSVTSANGRYRLQGTSNWSTFQIDLNNPQTPNINTLGIYEIQVNITDNSGSVSEWSPTQPVIFSILKNCDNDGGGGGGDDPVGNDFIIVEPTCREYRITNINSQTPWNLPSEVEIEYCGELQFFVEPILLNQSIQVCSTDDLVSLLQNPDILIEDLGDCGL